MIKNYFNIISWSILLIAQSSIFFKNQNKTNSGKMAMYRYSWLAYEINWHWSITEVSDLEFNLVLDGNNVVLKEYFWMWFQFIQTRQKLLI